MIFSKFFEKILLYILTGNKFFSRNSDRDQLAITKELFLFFLNHATYLLLIFGWIYFGLWLFIDK